MSENESRNDGNDFEYIFRFSNQVLKNKTVRIKGKLLTNCLQKFSSDENFKLKNAVHRSFSRERERKSNEDGEPDFADVAGGAKMRFFK